MNDSAPVADVPLDPDATRARRIGCEHCGYVSDIPRGYGVDPDPEDGDRKLDRALRDLVRRYRESPNDALRLAFAAELEAILDAADPLPAGSVPV